MRTAADHWKAAVETYRYNQNGLGDNHPVGCIDMHELRGSRLTESVAQAPEWVVGGPPCQGFSTVGKRQREDPRNDLFLEFRRIVQDLRPEGFVIENVLGLKDMSFEAAVKASFESLGYRVRPRFSPLRNTASPN